MNDKREPQPTLTGARVVLRPWTGDDVDVVFAACQDPEIQRWTTVPSPYRHEDAVDYVREVAPRAWDDGGAVFAVLDAVSGAVTGSIGCHSMRDQVAHVGYWTAPAGRGRGLTSDALRTLARWLLDGAGAERVELVAEPDNLASRGVAESAGFVLEGTMRRRLLLKGRRADAVMYSLIRTDERR